MSQSNKKKSGWEFKKQKEFREKENKKQSGALSAFLNKASCSREIPKDSNENEPQNKKKKNNEANQETNSENTNNASVETNAQEICFEDKYASNCSISNVSEIPTDPSKWQTITDKMRQVLVKRGPPTQVLDINFPIDDNGRHFSASYYSRILPNGEKYSRGWLVYSTSKDAVFCFACILFSKTTTNWSVCGNSDWIHLSRDLKRHEVSSNHFKSTKCWMELDLRIKSATTIDNVHQNLIGIETRKWQEILKRIISVLQFLGSQNLAIRGSSENLYDRNNGNFLKLMELLAKFDKGTEVNNRLFTILAMEFRMNLYLLWQKISKII